MVWQTAWGSVSDRRQQHQCGPFDKLNGLLTHERITCVSLCVRLAHHDLLFELRGLQITRQRKESFAHVSRVIQVCECLEEWDDTQQFPVVGIQAKLFLRATGTNNKATGRNVHGKGVLEDREVLT